MPTIRFPPALSGTFLFDVKAYGAIGDGVADDTAAIQAATTAACDTVGVLYAVVYFPIGTYLLSDRILTHASSGSPPTKSRKQFIGEDRDLSIIKLKDNCAGFDTIPQDLLTFYPRGMIRNSGSNPLIGTEDGSNNAFFNTFKNMTMDIGTGNVGACAIDFNGNNWCLIENMLLRSSDPDFKGHSLLYMGRPYPGPGYARNLELRGSEYPLFILQPEYSFIFEGLTIRRARTRGIYCQQNMAIIRALDYIGVPPAYLSSSSLAALTLLDSILDGHAESDVVVPPPPVEPTPPVLGDAAIPLSGADYDGKRIEVASIIPNYGVNIPRSVLAGLIKVATRNHVAGSIAADGVSQQVLAANTARKLLEITNNSDDVLYVEFGASASTAGDSFEVLPHDTMSFRLSVPVASVHVNAVMAGHRYVVVEGS